MKRRGFTLIELMVVVGIIAILSTLLIVGIGKLQTNSKRQQTVQLLENCRAMWAEYDSVNRRHFDLFQTPSPGNVTLESEIATEQQQNLGGNRIGGVVITTRAIFALMRSQPGIRAAMDKFPTARMFLTSPATAAGDYVALSFQGMGAYTARQYKPGYYPGSAVTWTEPLSGNKFAYLCIHNLTLNPDGSYTPPYTPSPPDTAYWLPLGGVIGNTIAADTIDPVLLDAWGNPVIAVPGAQLGVTGSLNADGSIPANSGIIKAGGRAVVVTSPDNRFFWASAGPDGDFSKGDDNIYSFEK